MSIWKWLITLSLLLLFTLPIIPEQPKGARIQTVTPNNNKLPSHLIKKEIIVRFREEPSESQWQKWQTEMQLDVHPHKLSQTYLIQSNQLSTKQLATFFKKQNTLYVEPHWIYVTQAVTPNDEYFLPYQWNLTAIQAPQAWDISKGTSKIKIAVIDTGVDLTHPDLQKKLLPGVNVLDSSKSVNDDNGHGTHVTGIIAATINNKRGIAGLTWNSKIMPIKALDGSGAGTSFSVADGIIEATDRGAHVINLSLGNYASSQFLRDSVRYANQHNVLVVAASGNDHSNQPSYPAAYPEVIAVAASTVKNQIAPFSNFGSYVDITAPGDNIASTYSGNQYASLSGTSMATPHVTALCALVRSINPRLSNAEVIKIITSTASDKGPAKFDPYFGHGIIQVNQALIATRTWKKQQAPLSTPPASPIPTPIQSTTITKKSLFEWLLGLFVH